MRTIAPDYKKWDRPVFRYRCVDDFMGVSAMRNGVHSVDVAGVPVDFLFHGKKARTLLVVFGGAAPRGGGTAPPYFSGIGISSDIQCSVVCVNDPSFYLDDDIRVAWYTGFRGLNLQRILPPMLTRVASLTSSRIVMFGGSGGGFASLYYAKQMKLPTLAVAFNAQTNIGAYNPGHLRTFARVCFGSREEDAPAHSYAGLIVSNLVDLYRTAPRPSVIYLQNRSDWHVQKHAVPFLRNYGIDWTGSDQVADGIYLHVGDWGEGHIAPPKSMLHQLLVSVCAWPGRWDDLLRSRVLPEALVVPRPRVGP